MVALETQLVTTEPPNKRMQRAKRHSAVGRRAPRAVVADLRFAADPQRWANDTRWRACGCNR